MNVNSLDVAVTVAERPTPKSAQPPHGHEFVPPPAGFIAADGTFQRRHEDYIAIERDH